MDFSQFLLSTLIWLPIAGGIAVLAMGSDDNIESSRSAGLRFVSLAVTLLTFIFSIGF